LAESKRTPPLYCGTLPTLARFYPGDYLIFLLLMFYIMFLTFMFLAACCGDLPGSADEVLPGGLAYCYYELFMFLIIEFLG
jgi:hypothetical protein